MGGRGGDYDEGKVGVIVDFSLKVGNARGNEGERGERRAYRHYIPCSKGAGSSGERAQEGWGIWGGGRSERAGEERGGSGARNGLGKRKKEEGTKCLELGRVRGRFFSFLRHGEGGEGKELAGSQKRGGDKEFAFGV